MAKQDPFSALTEAQQKQHLLSVAQRALACWELEPQSPLKLLSLSENATYRVDRGEAQTPLIMRVHRTGYHSQQAIQSELDWMQALQRDIGLATPQYVAGNNGQAIQNIETPELGESRFVVLFEFIPGNAPDENELIEPFKRLGAVTARMHQHAKGWQRPAGFERLVWDFDGTLGSVKHWGDWQQGPGLQAPDRILLQQVVDLIQQRLIQFGNGTEQFGLIHADLRLANLLESDGETRVIDFDDAGFGWYLYDLASALSFIETRDDLTELIDAWVSGYNSIRPLTAAELEEIPTFIMLRRLTLLAWIASHAETDLAQSQGMGFTRGTVQLGEHYLAKMDQP